MTLTRIVSGLTIVLSAASSAAAFHPLPTTRTAPANYRLKRSSNASSLYEIVLPANASYTSGSPLLVELVGTRFEVGRAYAELLGNETIDTFGVFLAHVFPDSVLRQLFIRFADWLWERFAAVHVPTEYLEELRGMRAGSPAGSLSIDAITRRFNVLSNLPADPQNLATMLEQELEKGVDPAVARLINEVIAALDHCTWCSELRLGVASTRARLPSSPRCDAYAAWGSRTEGGMLFASRNLDWRRNTLINRGKLVTVLKIEGTAGPYATFGHASGLGALAGMSSAGVTVAEMNLDNARTTFDGPPFPIRLRMVLERAASLREAKAVWQASNNTDSMNYMIGSAADRAALAIEAIGGRFASQPPHAAFSAFFVDGDPVETNATCEVGTHGAGTCGNGFPDRPATAGRKPIGSPLHDAVWRTNHAVHPTVMATQEPLFNDTTFRYELLHSLLDGAARAGVALTDKSAVGVAATLGIKGVNFFSCDPAQFADPYAEHVMSVVYAPRTATDTKAGGGPARAWVAWEDSTWTGGSWRPAACNPYVRIDFAGRFW